MDVGAWLRDLGLERYEQAFVDNDIDEALLPKLTSDDLKELGMASIGHRRRLLDAIAELGAAGTSAAEAPPERRPRRSLTKTLASAPGPRRSVVS